MMLKTASIILFTLFFAARAQACICFTNDLIGFGKNNGADVFEGNVVCFYGDQDLANLINQELIVFKIDRYWGEGSVPEYVVLTNRYGSSCSAFFKNKSSKYIIAAKRNDYGQYPISQCDMMLSERLTKEMISLHGKGLQVEPGSGDDRYLNICSKTEELHNTLANTARKLDKLERERIWNNLFFQSLLFYPFLLFVAWLGRKTKFYPVNIILKSISIATFLGLLLTSLLGLLLRESLPDVMASESLKPGHFGLYSYIWENLLWALLVVILTLPAFLSRLRAIKSRQWLAWLTFLLLPGLMQLFMIRHNFHRFTRDVLVTHDVLIMCGLLSGIFYLALLIYFLNKRMKFEKE
jgi:hypothetical protein